ncbi:specifically androgen-regulated gene protein isoform X2 [Mugil cephalus]|nr:specifically androgen-regulated gene protein isoform X2 [Mugil cephalus]
MEYLSAEERACLMYLEETIEALEVQEDSGLSNDEPELGSQTQKACQTKGNDIPSVVSDCTGSCDMSASPGTTTLATEGKHVHDCLNETSEPQSTRSLEGSKTELETMDLVIQADPPLSESDVDSPTHSSAAKNEELNSAPDGEQSSEVDVGVIPPPSDFMDEPQPTSKPKEGGRPSIKLGSTIDLELLRQRASAKKISVSSIVIDGPPRTPSSDEPPSLSPHLVDSGPQLSPRPETAEPRSPPSVAPKPKKLPPNIILKSQKAPAAGSDGNSRHSLPTGSDRHALDPQRVHIEALRKLGLLKSTDPDPGPVLSPKLSPKSRTSWAAPSPPISPAAQRTPPTTPSYTQFSSLPPTSAPLQSASPAAVSKSTDSFQPPDILPAPAAFSDPAEPLPLDNELPAVKDATVNSPPLTPPPLVKKLTPPRVIHTKSATLERSGLGLSSYMSGQNSSESGQGISGEPSMNQLRNNRPRPASLGSGKEFSHAQGEGLQAGPAPSKGLDSRSSVHTPTAFQQSQKLPRSQGISVLICPRAENVGNRREALKKLGLLRD